MYFSKFHYKKNGDSEHQYIFSHEILTLKTQRHGAYSGEKAVICKAN